MKLEIELNQRYRGIRFKNNLFIKKKDIDLLSLLNKKGKLDQIKILYPTLKQKKHLFPKINNSKSQDIIQFSNNTPHSLNLHYSYNSPLKLNPIIKNGKANYRQIIFKHLSLNSSQRNSIENTPINSNKKNDSINYSYNVNDVNKNDINGKNYNYRKCIYGKWNGVLSRNKEIVDYLNKDNEGKCYGNNGSCNNEEFNYSKEMLETGNHSCRSYKFRNGISKDFFLKPVHKFNKK